MNVGLIRRAALALLPAVLIALALPVAVLGHSLAPDTRTHIDVAGQQLSVTRDGAAREARNPDHLLLWLDSDRRVEEVRVVEVELTELDPGAALPEVSPNIATLRGHGFVRGEQLVEIEIARAVDLGQGPRLVRSVTIAWVESPVISSVRRPLRHDLPWSWKTERALGTVAFDARRNAPTSSPAAARGSAPAQSFNPTFRPTTDGSPVEYVIVTTAELEPVFQQLANWKTRKGVQAVVRTTEWIADSYPNGVDRAEQIRFFLRDAYDHWGALWLLIGGDTEVVPVRYASSAITTPPEQIPTDLYYSCLDGNWNGDADDRFGEGLLILEGDNADLGPELYVGRAPVSSLTEAIQFVAKIMSYESSPPVSALYPASVLLLGEELTPATDGADLCEDTAALLPPYLRVVKMYENYQQYPGALPETEATVLDSLDAGFGTVLHVGHGFRNTMSVGNGRLTNPAIDQLTNSDRISAVFAINCSSAAIDFNCIGERFVKNPNGGAISYIGASRLANTGPAQDFQNEFFELVFNDSLTSAGEALALSKVPFIGNATADNFVRWMMFAMLLIGDPETPIWHRQPAPLDAAHPSQIEFGQSPIEVTVTSAGSPLANARVTLQRSGESYAVGMTDANGMVQLSFGPESAGSATLTATKTGYVPYQATVPVIGTVSPYLHFSGLAVDDDTIPPSQGNGDGAADGGETIVAQVSFKNAGSTPASNVSVTIASADEGPFMTILDDEEFLGTIFPSGQMTANFELSFAPGAPPAFQPVFNVAINADERNWTDVFVVPVQAVELEHYGHTLDDSGNGVPEPGETITYTVAMRNNGPATAGSVSGTVRVLNRNTMTPDPDVTVTDGNASYGDLVPGTVVSGDPFVFIIGPGAIVDDLLLELTWSDAYSVRELGLSDLTPPGVVTELKAFGSQSSILLSWTPPADVDVKGYDIYRSQSAGGPYARVNTFTADGSALFEDPELPGLSRFYYYVTTRDSSHNESVSSAIISAATNPPMATGWPIQTAQETSSAVVADDIDPLREGLELVTGSESIYAWHSNGSELRDGDDNPITSGVFTLDGSSGDFGFHGTPAVADVDNDGELEIIGHAWTEAEVWVWDADGNAEPGWPQSVGGDFNWSSPAVDDLDFDGDMEIIVASGLQGIIYAWHHDGTELIDGDNNPATNGVVVDTPSNFLYASPGIGNITGGVEREFVIGTNSQNGAIYAFDSSGQQVPGWPIATGGQITSSAALADLDGNGYNEIIMAAEDDSIYVIQGDGSSFPGWPQRAEVSSEFGHTSSVSIGDIDGDGGLDVVFGASDGRMIVRDSSGNQLPGWNDVLFAQDALNAGATQCTATIADIDGDGFNEIVIGAEDGRIYGWNHDGTEADGFPITVNGEIRGAVSIWDLDEDGKIELATTSTDRNVYVWDLDGEVNGERLDWPFFRHDSRGTGRYAASVTAIGVDDVPAASPSPMTIRLLPAAPNPFNPTTTLRFEVGGERGGARPVHLAIFDVRGRMVRELVDGPIETGLTSIRWDGRNQAGQQLASGSYFVRLEVGGRVLTDKLVLLK